MSSKGTYADHYFIELCAEYLNRQIVIYPVHPEQSWKDGKNTINPISRKQPDNLDPLYFLYYSEVVFASPHYQSIRSKPKESLNPTNESGPNFSLRETTMQSIDLPNMTIPQL